MSAVIKTDEAEQARIRNPYEIDGPEAVKIRKLRLGDNIPDVETLTIEQRGEARAVGDQMATTYKRRVGYYKKCLLSIPENDPYRERFAPDKIDAMAREGSVDSTLAGGADDITWNDLQAAMEHAPDGAAILWQALKGIARESLDAIRRNPLSHGSAFTLSDTRRRPLLVRAGLALHGTARTKSSVGHMTMRGWSCGLWSSGSFTPNLSEQSNVRSFRRAT